MCVSMLQCGKSSSILLYDVPRKEITLTATNRLCSQMMLVGLHHMPSSNEQLAHLPVHIPVVVATQWSEYNVA